MSSGPDDKPALRADLLARRAARSGDELAAARSAIAHAVLTRARGRGWRTVAAYRPLRTEPGSTELLDGLVSLGLTVLVPVLLDDLDLGWSLYGDDQPDLGVDAIQRADALLVPALAVDRTGVRLGRGGGSYDRALARVGAGVPLAALLFDGEILDRLPREAWDRPVTAVVTPQGWLDVPTGRVDGE